MQLVLTVTVAVETVQETLTGEIDAIPAATREATMTVSVDDDETLEAILDTMQWQLDNCGEIGRQTARSAWHRASGVLRQAYIDERADGDEGGLTEVALAVEGAQGGGEGAPN